MLGCKAETTTPVLVAATVENCVQLEPPFMLYCQISATAEELAMRVKPLAVIALTERDTVGAVRSIFVSVMEPP